MSKQKNEHTMPLVAPTWVELESGVRMDKVEEITGLSEDTIDRVYPHLIRRPSVRTKPMQLKHAIAIANGTAPKGPP